MAWLRRKVCHSKTKITIDPSEFETDFLTGRSVLMSVLPIDIVERTNDFTICFVGSELGLAYRIVRRVRFFSVRPQSLYSRTRRSYYGFKRSCDICCDSS